MLNKPVNIVLVLSLSFFSFSTPAIEISKIQLPDMGDSAGSIISPAQEKELGKAFFRSLHAQININHDAEIQQYIQSIGRQLVANSDSPYNHFHFFVVLDKQINAFAGPAGYIGVNSGLLLLTESESELASVMAHEVAHVTQRHLHQAFEAASQLSIPMAAATLAAILLGSQNPEAGQAALIAIQAGSVQFQIDFTRDNEKEADRVGMQTLSKSRYNPRSMPVFFERLQQSSRYYGRDIPEFLRTHPVSTSRISDTRSRANKYAYRQYPDSQGYLLTKAKLRVITASNKKKVAKYFKARENLGTKDQQAIARYGKGLLLLESQKFSKAEKIFRQLVREYPEQPQYAYAVAKTAIEAQHYQKALQLFEHSFDRFPYNNAIKMDYIDALLKAKKPQKAKVILHSLSDKQKTQPLFFELMAKVYSDLKNPAESHRYVAEYYYATGNIQSAILQIQLAKKTKKTNFYQQAILNERLHFFLDEERERQLNQ